MGEAGIFAPETRLELIDGEVIEMSPIGSRHAGAVKFLNTLFVQRAGERALVSVQDPLIVGDYSVPEPDLALLKRHADNRYYARSHPTAADVLLVVEVADTTLAYDSDVKVPMYARAGVPEVWIVALQDRTIRVFRDPDTGDYRTRRTIAGAESATVQALPDIVVGLPDLFAT